MTTLNRFDRFAQQLRRALNSSPATHLRSHAYLPELAYGRHQGPAPKQSKSGAVLVLFYPDADDWHVVFTVRQSHLPTHAGQISFPGGRVEANETAETAAVREYQEEVGLLDSYHMIGTLPELYVFASNFRVVPCIALTEQKPLFQPNASEVADVFSLSLNQLADSSRHIPHAITRGPIRFSAPSFRTGSRHIWGATWIILGEIMARLEAIGPLQNW